MSRPSRSAFSSFVLVALFVLAAIPPPAAQAAVEEGLTVAVGPDPACALIETWQGGFDTCLIHVRTRGVSASSYQVRLDVEWLGDGPAGVSKSFSVPTVTCPASSGSGSLACAETFLRFGATSATWAPDTWGYIVTATRLCAGAPCDPLDQASFTQDLVIKRSVSVSASCPSAPFYLTLMTCTTTLRDGNGNGPRSTPAGTVRDERGAACTVAEVTENVAACSIDVRVINLDRQQVFWYDGGPEHGENNDASEIDPARRTTHTALVCGSPVLVGDGVTCTGRAFDVVVETYNPDLESPYGVFRAFSWAPGSGLHMPGTPGDSVVCELVEYPLPLPSECEFTFYPTSKGAKNFSGYYIGSTFHDDSVGNKTVLVLGHPTTATFDCGVASVPVNVAATCRAVVVDEDGHSRPTGTVSFTSAPSGIGIASADPTPGTFASATCALVPDPFLSDRSACQVDFTPDAASTGVGAEIRLLAEYAGDDLHDASGDAHDVIVAKRGTATTVECDLDILIPLSGIVPLAACAAVVVDDGPGSGLPATGNVSWTSVVPESFQDAVDRGNCTLSAGTPRACNIGAALPIGTQMLTATYAGDANHTGSVGADLVHVHAATSIVSDGARAVMRGGSFSAKAILASASHLCSQNRVDDPFGVTFRLDRDPLTGAAGAFTLGGSAYGTVGTDSGGRSTLPDVSTSDWLPGVYTLNTTFLGDPYCDPSWDDAPLVVADPGDVAWGAGWVPLNGRTDFAFRVRALPNGTHTGEFSFDNAGKWRLSGNLSGLVRSASGGIAKCAANGVGALEYGVADAATGRVSWLPAIDGAQTRFGIYFEDAGAGGKKTSDKWTIHIGHVVRSPPEPNAMPGSSAAGAPTLKSGDVGCK